MNAENEPRMEEANRPITIGSAEENGNPNRPVWVIILAIAGILAVIVALGIGIFQLAGRTPENISQIGSNLGNLFGREERLNLDVENRTIDSAETVTLSVEHVNPSEAVGTYTIEFECEETVTAELNGTAVACNEEIDLDSVDEAIQFTLTSTTERYVDVPVVVRFVSDEAELSSDILVTVVNSQVEDTTEGETEADEEVADVPEQIPTSTDEDTEEVTPEYVTVEREGRVTDPNGTPDLKIVIEETGFIDRDGDFVEADEIEDDDRAAVRFYVINDGTKVVNAGWHFSSLLPTEDEYYFQSVKQPALYPGDKVVFELAFDNIDEDEVLYLNVDPANLIKEASEDNNIKLVEFDVER